MTIASEAQQTRDDSSPEGSGVADLAWRERRGSILLETGEVLLREDFPAEQHVLRLQAPRIAAASLPGQFVHLRCDEGLPMRRPMSIMRVNAQQGWIDVLFKVHGQGTALLARRVPGDDLSLLGPIGKPFRQSDYRPRALLIGGGVGIPPMVFLAEHLRQFKEVIPLVIMGSEVPFPFDPRPSAMLVPDLPAEATAAAPLLEDWGIASRLASNAGFPGCFAGTTVDLARSWLSRLEPGVRQDVEIFACGPTPMLRAVAELAEEFAVPAEISLEEYMACAVGGCAGCTVPIRTETGIAMQRVCVDGPVFAANTVVFHWPPAADDAGQ